MRTILKWSRCCKVHSSFLPWRSRNRAFDEKGLLQAKRRRIHPVTGFEFDRRQHELDASIHEHR